MSQIITDKYKEQLELIREGRPHNKPWGVTGARNFGEEVLFYLRHRPKYRTILDFGAGEGGLGAYIRENLDRDIRWTDYDPGVKGIDKLPSQRFDLIVSSDVLEHVEPEMVDQTIDWLLDHANKSQYHHIASDPGGLHLPDGRNVHLTCETMDWWLRAFEREGWDIMYCHDAWIRKRGNLRNHCHIMMEWIGGKKPDKMKYYSDDPARGGLKEAPRPYTPRYVPDLPLDEIAGRIIRNPAYGGPTAGIHGWCVNPKVSMGKKPMFMEALGESLLKEGYRNPVILYATDSGNYLSFGGSRVLVGRKVGLRSIPAIINDYCGRFDSYVEVTEENFASFFTDVPKWHVIDELGVDYHYAIERKRRAEYDPAGHNWCAPDAPFMHVEFPWIGEGKLRDPLRRKQRTEISKGKSGKPFRADNAQ